VINLTNTPAIREQDPHWSHDGSAIAFAYKPKDGSQYDIALVNWSTRKVQKLTNEQQPGYSWNVVAWSSDDKTTYSKWENFAGNFSPDGKRYTYIVSEDGLMDAYLADCSTNRAEKIDLAHALKAIAQSFPMRPPTSQGDLWIYNLKS
jgi:Tol biopolymer transport system component